MRREENLLLDIVEAIDAIAEYRLQPESQMMQDAILYQLVIIGEVANILPKELKTRYPKIAWKKIIDARNVFVHHYHGVDLDTVHGIVINHLPELRIQITTILKELEG